jgi:hypothetical protein
MTDVLGKNWLRSFVTLLPRGTTGQGAQPQMAGSGARLKELNKKLATHAIRLLLYNLIFNKKLFILY